MVKKLVFPGEDINNFDFEALWYVSEINDDEKSFTYAGTGKNEGLQFTLGYKSRPEEYERVKKIHLEDIEHNKKIFAKELSEHKISEDEYKEKLKKASVVADFIPEFFLDEDYLEEEDLASPAGSADSPDFF